VKFDLPPEMFGGNPAGLIDHLGLVINERPDSGQTIWDVSAKSTALVESQVLHGPALKRSRFDVSTVPTPEIPGGMPPELFGEFDKLAKQLDAHPNLAAQLERVTNTLIAAADTQVPDAIRWGSETLGAIPLEHSDGTTEPLFARHSVHDIRIDPIAYRWSKLPQIFLRLQHNTAAELVELSNQNPDRLTFQASGALLEGTISGGLYFAPLLGNLSPLMWGVGAPRIGQIVIYTFGRAISGSGIGPSRDQLDALNILAHHGPSHDFATAGTYELELHKAAFSDAVDWWAGRINNALADIFAPTRYIDGNGLYLPAVHQRWMLNFEQLLSRVGTIVRHPRDQGAQLMLMFPAMDILGDSFTASGGIGQLMLPSRIRKTIVEIEEHVPQRIKNLIMAPAYRALAAAEQVADEFIVPSPSADATTESRLRNLWNARRNTTHGFNANAEILAEHSGRLPADIVLVPMVYLLDILTDRQRLLEHIKRTCH
jgi:hypothetical protein